MELTLHRFSDNGTDTLGLMSIDCKFDCFTLEDEHRSEKVKGETRIPSGKYEVKFREQVSGLTEKYRKRFPKWFTFHLHIQDVPNFKYVYMHIGNNEDHSDGCILLGDNSECEVIGGDRHIYKSVQAFERFYKKVAAVLETNTKVYLTIKDEGEWL